MIDDVTEGAAGPMVAIRHLRRHAKKRPWIHIISEDRLSPIALRTDVPMGVAALDAERFRARFDCCAIHSVGKTPDLRFPIRQHRALEPYRIIATTRNKNRYPS